MKEISPSDTKLMFTSGLIMVKDELVIWLDPTYPDKGGALSDIKRMADAGKLTVDKLTFK